MTAQLELLPLTVEELDRIRASCKIMVRRRAATSAGMTLIPVPGVDVVGDVAMLMQLIPAINRKFGLTPEQIECLDTARKVTIYAMVRNIGADLVGRAITRKLVILALKKVSTRLATRQVIKYLPVAGQAVAAALGVTAMIYLGNSHVDACYEVAKGAIRK